MAELKDFDYFTVEKHIKEKSMWLGTKKIGKYDEWLYDPDSDSFEKDTVKYSPALLKTFWELLCNAVDASIRNTQVKNIFIEFYEDEKDGYKFTVYNDGGGIPVKFDKRVNQWLPEAIATNPFSGSNLKKNQERRTGGTNGLGMKLCNFFSSKFMLESYDGEKGYSQIFTKRMKNRSEPIIIEWKDLKKKDQKKRVYIEYCPYWKGFTYDADGPKGMEASTLKRLVHTMAYQAAAYVRKGTTVKFNDTKIPVNTLQDYAKLFCENTVSMTLKHKTDPWDVIIGIHDGGSMEIQSFVNGIYVRGGGDHIKALENMVVESLKDRTQKLMKDKTSKRFNRNMITNHLFIFQRGDVPNPDFDGQRKDQLRAPPKQFKEYELPKAAMTKVWNILKDEILVTYAQKQRENDTKTTRKKKLKIADLRDADDAGGNNSLSCSLLLFEGNTAEAMGRRMLTNQKAKLGYKTFGTYNLRGVPQNARKKIKIIKRTVIRQNGWNDEKNRLHQLTEILGLDYNLTYEDEKDMKRLRYGQVIMMVDQDIDGVGNILSLTLNFFNVFWPNLLKHGFIKQLNTPLIRVFPRSRKEKIKEFYSDYQYREWIENEFDGSEPPSAKYRVKYYKGLGTHEKPEVAHIAQNFNSNVITFTAKEKVNPMFEAFFGTLAAPRKRELAKPMKEYPKYEGASEIPCRIHLMRDTKEFQNEKNYRNLKCFSDGMNPSRRKILMGALDKFKATGNSVKVFQLGGYVAEHYQYHHGDASLNGTIVRMGQQFLGSNYLPLLREHGEFGSRNEGGKDAGQPRYIEVSLNRELVQILYPSQDRYILEYKYEDGVRSEPKEWPSIIPMTLVERCEGIGTGWRQVVWAREIFSVINNIERKILDKPLKEMPPENHGFGGRFRIVDGVEYCVGMYEKTTVKLGRNEYTCIIISELPIGTWPKQYLEWLDSKKSDYIYDVKESCSDKIHIEIYLHKTITKKVGGQQVQVNVMQDIKDNYGSEHFTPIEECFQLRTSMKPFLNCTDKDGIVHEFKSYEDIFDNWFEIRKTLYQMRIKGWHIMTKLRIKYLENIIRFSEVYKDLKLANKSEEVVLKKLDDEDFLPFVKSPIDEPKYVPIDELKQTYLGEGATYNYLVNLSTRDMYVSSVEKRREQLKKYLELLDDIKDKEGMWLGGKWWLRELNMLKDVIKKGRSSNWQFGHTNFNF